MRVVLLQEDKKLSEQFFTVTEQKHYVKFFVEESPASFNRYEELVARMREQIYGTSEQIYSNLKYESWKSMLSYNIQIQKTIIETHYPVESIVGLRRAIKMK